MEPEFLTEAEATAAAADPTPAAGDSTAALLAKVLIQMTEAAAIFTA